MHIPSDIRDKASRYKNENIYDKLFDEAERAESKGRYEEAIEKYKTAHNMDIVGVRPSGDALHNCYLMAGQSAVKKKEFEKAILYYNEAIKLEEQGFQSGSESSNKVYDCYLMAAKNEENKGNYEKAITYFNEALNIKPDEEDAVKKLIADVNKKKYRDKMVRKYGTNMGNKIAEGIIEIGMSKEMVLDALQDDIIQHSYKITKSQTTNRKVEIWEYDYELARKYINQELGDDAQVVNSLLLLGSLFGVSLQQELSGEVEYKYMVFHNDVLVEFRNTSTYDRDPIGDILPFLF